MADAKLEAALNAPHFVELQGEQYEVKSLTLAQRVKLEKQMGEEFDNISVGSAQVQLTIITMILQRTDSKLTEEKVGEMLDGEDQDVMNEIIIHSFQSRAKAAEQLGNMAARREAEAIAEEAAKLNVLSPPTETT